MTEPPSVAELISVVDAELQRTERQIESLALTVAAIVEAAELVSTDDEHDPEGSTIAYERAQATALLRQARADREALLGTRRQLAGGGPIECATCAGPIDPDRIAALPTAARCVTCAR